MFAEGLKSVLPSLISKNQTAYVKGRFISEEDRLISDILEISDNLEVKGFLMTLDIEKAFDSVNLLFLITALECYSLSVSLASFQAIHVLLSSWQLRMKSTKVLIVIRHKI